MQSRPAPLAFGTKFLNTRPAEADGLTRPLSSLRGPRRRGRLRREASHSAGPECGPPCHRLPEDVIGRDRPALIRTADSPTAGAGRAGAFAAGHPPGLRAVRYGQLGDASPATCCRNPLDVVAREPSGSARTCTKQKICRYDVQFLAAGPRSSATAATNKPIRSACDCSCQSRVAERRRWPAPKADSAGGPPLIRHAVTREFVPPRSRYGGHPGRCARARPCPPGHRLRLPVIIPEPRPRISAETNAPTNRAASSNQRIRNRVARLSFYSDRRHCSNGVLSRKTFRRSAAGRRSMSRRRPRFRACPTSAYILTMLRRKSLLVNGKIRAPSRFSLGKAAPSAIRTPFIATSPSSRADGQLFLAYSGPEQRQGRLCPSSSPQERRTSDDRRAVTREAGESSTAEVAGNPG